MEKYYGIWHIKPNRIGQDYVIIKAASKEAAKEAVALKGYKVCKVVGPIDPKDYPIN